MSKAWIRTVPIVALLAGCGPPPPQPSLAELKAKIQPTAIYKSTPADYPKLARRIGKVSFKEGAQLTEWAALRVAMVDSCSKVNLIDYSDLSVKGDVRWFANCEGGLRYFVSQEQAEQVKMELSGLDPNVPLSEGLIHTDDPKGDKLGALNEVTAISNCDMLVKSVMDVPSSFSTWSQWSKSQNAEKRTATFQRDFEAKNAYGMKMSSTYVCTVSVNDNSVSALKFRNGSGWQRVQLR